VFGLENSFRRGHPFFVALLVAIAALLQARGLASIVAAHIEGGSSAHAAPPGKLPPAASRPTTRAERSATAILTRNAFDSVTGPLEGRPPPMAAGDDAGETGETGPCSQGEVRVITEADDPAFSFATVVFNAKSRLVRLGDDVEGKRLERIDWDRIWLSSGGASCWLRLGGPGLAAGGVAKSTTTDVDTGAARTPAAPAPSVGSLAAGVTRVGENSFALEGKATEEMRNLQGAMMKGARVVAGQGVRITRATNLTTLGFARNDLVKTVNGFDMTDPDQAVEAYGKMKTARKVQVRIERGGKEMTLDYELR
jgi:general secretion pathway protein C